MDGTRKQDELALSTLKYPKCARLESTIQARGVGQEIWFSRQAGSWAPWRMAQSIIAGIAQCMRLLPVLSCKPHRAIQVLWHPTPICRGWWSSDGRESERIRAVPSQIDCVISAICQPSSDNALHGTRLNTMSAIVQVQEWWEPRTCKLLSNQLMSLPPSGSILSGRLGHSLTYIDFWADMSETARLSLNPP